MENTRELFMIGLELSRENTQISYMLGNCDVLSMSTISDEQKYNIPTRLLKQNGKFVWCVGDEALVRNKEGQGTLITDLLDKVIRDESVNLDDNEYRASELLDIYLTKIVELIQINVSEKAFSHIVITIEELNPRLVQAITDTFVGLSIPKENIRVISHTESFIYYVTYQNRSIWNNQVLLFDFQKRGLTLKRLSVKANCTPAIITVKEEPLENPPEYALLRTKKGQEEADERFGHIASAALHGQLVSAVFLIGEGFKKSWAQKTIRILCDKRRVFQGDNLIAKGAGYAARDLFYNSRLEQYIFNCTGRVRVNVGLMVVHHSREMEHILVHAGESYTTAKVSMEAILDHVKDLRFHLASPLTGKSKMMAMELPDLPKRPDRTTRICIKLQFEDEDHFNVTVTDLGFGEFFKATGKVYQESVSLEGF